MFEVILGSNRADNSTAPFAAFAMESLRDMGESAGLLDLGEMPGEVLYEGMYEPGGAHAYVVGAQQRLAAAAGWVFVFPEYNGTFPGVVKLFIDAVSVIDYQATFSGKRVALIGTATGRSGNLRGLDHFAAVMAHVGSVVMPQSLPISQIAGLLDDGGQLRDAATQETLRAQMRRFVDFVGVAAAAG